MARRKASFIGSDEWWDRDVTKQQLGDENRVTDFPTKIGVWSRVLPLGEMRNALVHRVKQLTT